MDKTYQLLCLSLLMMRNLTLAIARNTLLLVMTMRQQQCIIIHRYKSTLVNINGWTSAISGCTSTTDSCRCIHNGCI
eukprot:scaffold15800_cov88-Skeletonema_marinoi.AAC.1